jgi:hypothetical protein
VGRSPIEDPDAAAKPPQAVVPAPERGGQTAASQPAPPAPAAAPAPPAPPAPASPPVAQASPPPASAAPAPNPAAPATRPPAATRPSTPPASPAPAAPPPAVASNPPAAVTPAPATEAPRAAPTPAVPSAATLDFESLVTRLRETKAIGVLTKISVKNQSDDLIEKFRAYHQEQAPPLAELRRSYDMLLLKLLSLLQDGDPPLAKDIDRSRTAIWEILADRNKFVASNLMAGA